MDVKSFFSKKADEIRNALRPYTPYVGQVAQGIGRDVQSLGNRIGTSFNTAAKQTFQPWTPEFQQQQRQFTSLSRSMPESSLGGRTAQFLEGVRTSVPGMSLAFRDQAANDPTTMGGKLSRTGGALAPALITGGTLGTKSFGQNVVRALPEIGISGAIGGGLNKLMGGDPLMGVAQGIGVYSTTKPIGSLTNPLINRFAGNVAGKFNNPVTQSVAGRLGAGLSNIPEGMIMSSALGRPYSPTDALMDVGVGTLTGGQNVPLKNNLSKQRYEYIKTKIPKLDEVLRQADREDRRVMEGFLDVIRTGKFEGKTASPEIKKEIFRRAQDILDGMGISEVNNRTAAKSFELFFEADKTYTGPKNVMNFAQSKPQGILKTANNKPKLDRTKLTGMQLDTPNAKLKAFDDVTKNVPEKIPGFDEDLGGVLKDSPIEPVYNNPGKRMEKRGVIPGINRVMNPLKNAPDDVQGTVRNWNNTIQASKIKADKVVDQFPEIARVNPQDGWKIIQYIQDPKPQTAKSLGLNIKTYKNQIDLVRKYYVDVLNEGRQRGLDVKELDNYINQVWKESPQQIETIARGLGKVPQFVKERRIPSYKEGIELGLTPRFTNPVQLMAHYRYQMEKALANKGLLNNLVEKGQLLPQSEANKMGYTDWQVVNAPFFPMATGKDVIQPYVAAPDTAIALNSIFSDQRGNEVLSATANAGRLIQDFALSGGIPRTHVNAFTLANAVKEMTAGRFSSPIKAFFSTDNKGYLNSKRDVLEKMAQNGVGIRTPESYETAFTNILENKGLKEKLGDSWDKLFNDPTFKGFIPRLQVQFFEDTYKSALKDGLDDVSAQKLAAQSTKNFYGVVDNLSRSKNTDNALSTLFLAPKFRESMVNFWISNLKALDPRKLGAKEYRANQKFLVGTALTFGLYELVNKQLTGHWMHENKEGKKLSVEIPRENGRSWFIPLLPSISTVPRNTVEAGLSLAGGDVATATQKAGTLLSPLASTGSSLLSNQTFYNAPIYDEEDTGLQKAGKLGGYAFEQLAHPMLGEPMSVMQGRKTPFEAFMGLLELPVYPSRGTDYAGLTGSQYNKYKGLKGDIAEDYAKTAQEGNKARKELKKSESGVKQRLTDAMGKANAEVVDDKYYYMDGTDLKSIDLGKYKKKPTDPVEAVRQERERFQDAMKVYRNETLSEDQKKDVLNKLGASYDDTKYYDIASDTEEIRRIVVDQVIQNSPNREGMMRNMVKLLRQVSGQSILRSGIIDDLYNEGQVTYVEKQFLKNIDYTGKSPKTKGKKSSAGRKPKLPAMPRYKEYTPKFYEPNIAPISTGQNRQSAISVPNRPRPRLTINMDQLRNPTMPRFNLK